MKRHNRKQIKLTPSNKPHDGTRRLLTSTPGAIIGLILFGTILQFSCGVGSGSTYATDSTLTLTIDNSTVSMDVSPTNINGSFNKSTASTISASTDNATGYTLKIAAPGAAGANYDKLLNGSGAECDNIGINTNSNSNYVSSNCLNSLKEATPENTFKGVSSTGYNGLWGYLPSKYHSADNTDFLPAPTTSGDILDQTATANTNNTPNTYSLAIGARVDSTVKSGSYTNVFLVQATANPVPYTIDYVDDSIGSMPVDVDTVSTDTNVQISSNIPTRNGYTFNGWCTVTPTTNANGTDTCSSTTVQPGGTITISEINVNQNHFTLHAMWTGNYTIDGVTYMQDFATMDSDKKAKIIANMTVGTQYQLTDNRDNIKYWIAKQADGKIWMTQNLDLCVGCTGVAALTSDNTDLNSYGSGIYSTDYSMTDGLITWTPQATTGTDYASPITSAQIINGTSVTWVDSQIYPWSAEAGERYYYTSDSSSADYSSTSCNTSDDSCKHYHVGNYYNWPEAIASSDSTNISVEYTVAENSICPAGWRLMRGLSSNTSTAYSREFGQLLYTSGIIGSISTTAYSADGFNNIRKEPLYLVRGGTVWTNELHEAKGRGRYWSSTVYNGDNAHRPFFDSGQANSGYASNRKAGSSVRCLLRS